MKPGIDHIGVGAFALILNNKNQFLLIRTKKSANKSKEYDDVWSLPGGTIEFGETVQEALMREVKEETGLDITDIKLLTYNDFIRPKEGKHWVSLSFVAIAVNSKHNILDSSEVEECCWFDFNDIPKNISQYALTSIKLAVEKNE
jgi:ADP-ribose pyrophosphatase YjhB (NUDIX family)